MQQSKICYEAKSEQASQKSIEVNWLGWREPAQQSLMVEEGRKKAKQGRSVMW